MERPPVRPWTLPLAGAALAILIYLPALGNGFAYDDAIVIQGHPLVVAHAWGPILTSSYHVGRGIKVETGAYRPLTIASYALDHLLSGGRPFLFHLTSVLAHALATGLVTLLALRLGLSDWGAAAGALLFAVHPVHVEAVAALAGRADLLAAVLVLAAVLASRPAIAGAMLALALFAKESALPAAALLPLVPWATGRKRDARGMAIAAACAVALYLVVRMAVLGRLTVPPGGVTFYENPVVGQSLGVREMTALGILARAAGLLVAPVKLTPDYGFAVVTPATSLGQPLVLAGLGVLVGVAAAIWALRRSPRALWLIAWCAATYAIVSNAVIVIGTALAERQLYLPSVGACLLAALAFEVGVRRLGPRVPVAVVGIIATVALVRTTTWTRAWSSDATLFEAALRSAPRSIRVLGNLGVTRSEQGRLEESRALLERAVAIAPNFVPNLVNLAGVELDLGAPDRAIRIARQAVEADPRSAPAAAQLGLALAAAGDLDGAERSLEDALRLDPDFADAREKLERIRRARAGS